MQRKIFRIEQTIGRRHRHAPARPGPHPHIVDASDAELTSLKQDLAQLRDAFAQNTQALAALASEGTERRMTRAAGELGAAVDTMEKATDKILQSAEVIDDCAKALTLAPIGDYERGLAQDIQEHVVRIYESCNFQDLAGQRIGKVVAMLDFVDRRLSEVIAQGKLPDAACRASAPASVRELINGPRLDGDPGHANQDDIDLMFG